MAVVGVAKPPQGEVGIAFVVKKSGQALDEERIRLHCQQHLARYKQPKYVAFVNALPMNASGKILKNTLRQQAVEQGLARERN